MSRIHQHPLLPKISILNVDDEPDLLELSKVYLEKENARFVVDTSLSVKDALKKMKKVTYDVIISDYQMPDMNGLEFLEYLRIQGNNIPFIIFTGRGREEVAIRALNIGADRYVQKGGDPKTQYGVLAQAVVSEVTRRKTEEFVIIQRDLGIGLSSSTTLQHALSEIIDAALKLEGIDAGGIYVIDQINGGLKLAYSRGLSDDFIQRVSYIDKIDPRFKLVMKGKPKFGPHKKIVPSTDEYRLEEGIQSLGVLPALFKKKVVAVLNVASYTNVEISKHTQSSLEAIASQIGSTISRIHATDALKESQQKLKESEKYLRTAQEITQLGYWELDFTTQKMKLSKEMQKILEFVQDSIDLTELFEIIHSEDIPKAQIAITRAKQELRDQAYEFRVITLTGKVKYIWINSSSIVGNSGKIERVFGSGLDITERKLIEENFRKSEVRYRRLFEESPISLWEEDFTELKKYIEHLRQSEVVDFRKYFDENPDEIKKCSTLVKILDINQATVELYKAESKDQILGNLDIVFCEESYQAFKEEIIAIAEGKQHVKFEAINRNLKGEKFPIDLGLYISSEDTSDIALVSCLDITDRKKSEMKLYESEERLRLFMDSATDALALWDSNLNLVMVNKLGEQMIPTEIKEKG